MSDILWRMIVRGGHFSVSEKNNGKQDEEHLTYNRSRYHLMEFPKGIFRVKLYVLPSRVAMTWDCREAEQRPKDGRKSDPIQGDPVSLDGAQGSQRKTNNGYQEYEESTGGRPRPVAPRWKQYRRAEIYQGGRTPACGSARETPNRDPYLPSDADDPEFQFHADFQRVILFLYEAASGLAGVRNRC